MDHRFEFLIMFLGMEVFIAALEIVMNLKFLQGRGMSHFSYSVQYVYGGGGECQSCS